MQPLLTAFKRTLRQPGFLVAFLVLLLAAITLNAGTQYLKLHFKKLPVALASPLDTIPLELGDWYCVSKDELTDEMVQELATDKFVFRDYVNLKLLGMSRESPEVRQFEVKSARDRRMLLGQLRSDPRFAAVAASAIVNMAVTYYTGKADTVAHIPDRCYIADGYQPDKYTFPEWNVNARLSNKPDGNVTVRFIEFDDATGVASHQKKNVAYFFHTNGHYTDDPLEVRRSLQNLWEKYGYYAKVELMTVDPNHDQAEKTMRSFLTAAIRPIEDTLPNWNSIQR